MNIDQDRMSPSSERIARAILRFGQVWNGFEVVGDHHIPDGPALFVLYHGFMPLDGWYFVPWLYFERGRLVRGLADDFLFKTPVLRHLVTEGGAVPAHPTAAKALLDAGHLVLVSPGGVREAIVGRRRHYQVVWGERKGFARLANAAKVPIIPLFAENVEELYRSPFVDRRLFQEFYERTRVPLVPVAGMGMMPFPVKLRMHVGAPIPYDPGDDPTSLRDKTRTALQRLMDTHQGGRPRILRALVQRLRAPR